MYWENPFYDVDETIKGVLNIPYEHSPELTSLLKGMMEKDVSARLTLPQVEKHPWTQLPCNPDQYTFHHVVHCFQCPASHQAQTYISEGHFKTAKRERNPKHYLRDYIQNGEDTAASSRSFLDEELHQNQLVSTPPPVPIRRANSATTPRRPSHPGKK
ncbi:PAS domain-containing serine/threonine-protein kinase [Portunus trituberculatus]|uniref:PAS domain-containing serine/threonine-protein kinase n=1 Tax=Portunus trituberculatus TaxID=210409 RepID=A0A5B7H9Y6_PORTR|nr:PAS domain-containing serine/threonine-protein kinase [Portunus trituberculatus]